MTNAVDRKHLGMLFALASYGMYSFHYATMKWLDTHHSTPLMQLLFVRSVVMVGIALLVGKRGTMAAAISSPYKVPTLLRGVLQFLSITCFFIAERDMSLSEVTTLYTTAPLIIVVLSVFLLGERIQGFRWVALIAGFAGTVVAAHPSGTMNAAPALLALLAAFFWALAVIYTRKSGARESADVQLLLTGIVFVAMSGATMTWTPPSTKGEWALMIAQGGQVYIALYCFFQACRFAPASLVGPLEYSSVVWACIFGYMIFASVPTSHVLLGAVLVSASGVVLAGGVRRQKACSAAS